MYDRMEPFAKKRFLEDILKKYSTMDATKKNYRNPDQLNHVLTSLRK